MGTCVAFESALEVAGLELPDFYRTVFWRCGELGVLRVESYWGDGGFVSGHRVLRGCFGQIELVYINVLSLPPSTPTLRYLILQTLTFFLQHGDFLLQRQDGLPLDLELLPIGVDLLEVGSDLLGEYGSGFGVVVIDEVLE